MVYKDRTKHLDSERKYFQNLATLHTNTLKTFIEFTLISKKGNKVLSTAAPKEIAEIEKIMTEKSKTPLSLPHCLFLRNPL